MCVDLSQSRELAGLQGVAGRRLASHKGSWQRLLRLAAAAAATSKGGAAGGPGAGGVLPLFSVAGMRPQRCWQ